MSDNRTWALNVADNASCGIVHEFHAHLGNTTTGACAGLECILNCCSHSFRGMGSLGLHVPVRPRTRKQCQYKMNATDNPAHTAGDFDELDGDLGGIHVCGLHPLATVLFTAGPFQHTLD